MPNKGTNLFVPIYQEPEHLFLYHGGEMLVDSENGPVTTIFELLINFDDEKYPINIGKSSYTKETLLFYASQQLISNKNQVIRTVDETGYKKIWDMCLEYGYDPSIN